MTTLIETPQHLGAIVRQTRKSLRLTQPQLALAAGLMGQTQNAAEATVGPVSA